MDRIDLSGLSVRLDGDGTKETIAIVHGLLVEIVERLMGNPDFVDTVRNGDLTPLTSGVVGDLYFGVFAVSMKGRKKLGRRERDVVALVGQGLGNKGIAEKLGLSENTVAQHLRHAYGKWHLPSRACLARVTLLTLT